MQSIPKLDIEQKYKQWLELNPDQGDRINDVIDIFEQHFGETNDQEYIITCAPGRAEILGNHTDYNEGFTLSANITRNLLIIASKNLDNIIRLVSVDKGNEIVEVNLNETPNLSDQKSNANSSTSWSNYIKGVLWSFQEHGLPVTGFNAVIQSTIPIGAGVSSSAAIELATAYVLNALCNNTVTHEELVTICKKAENEYVGAPCGFLDQGTIALADNNWLYMDYRKNGHHEFSWKIIPFDLASHGYSLVVGYDPESKHQIVDGKYAVRQEVCKKSIPILQQLLPNKTIKALRDISPSEFEQVKQSFLKLSDHTSTNYVTHIVYDNDRVLQASKALEIGDLHSFGELMTASGKSSIELYDLAEGSPELLFVYNTIREYQSDWNVLGVRNMGGGFNATTLTLIPTKSLTKFETELNEMYRKTFNRPYSFLDFVPSPSAGIIVMKSLTQK